MWKFLRVTALWVLLLPYAAQFIGAASNQLVLIANHDTFPVMVNPIRIVSLGGDPTKPMIDTRHCQMTKETHLNLLADIFDFHQAIYSIGDGLLMLGEWLDSFCFYVWAALVITKLRSSNAA